MRRIINKIKWRENEREEETVYPIKERRQGDNEWI